MFKLIIMYTMLYQSAYPIQVVQVVGGFKNSHDCAVFAKVTTREIADKDGFVKGAGSFQCEKDDR